MERQARYGVGEQSFEVMRTGDFNYVDKTRYIEYILKGGQYFFLGRPRRFGKSLFLSTLKNFFIGKRELFKGLYADTMDWKWEPYPVLYLDLNVGYYSKPENLDERLSATLRNWEDQYGLEHVDSEPSIRMESIIKNLYEMTGNGVVILVDEYDKPLVHNLNNPDLFEIFRKKLASFYSNFKSSADYIRLVFLTGVSRFGHLSIFSGLNNIADISFDDRYSAICGISENELKENFKEGIAAIARKALKEYGEIENDLKRWYDGYRFSGNGIDMYNPFSIVSAMDKEEIRNYWIYSGQATLLANQLIRFNVNLEDIINAKCSLTELMGIDLDNPSPLALLYQTGYLTIKDFNPKRNIYRLGIPNEEVNEGFLSFLLPYYANLRNKNSMVLVYNMIDDLNCGEVDKFMSELTSMFASVSYEMNMGSEQNLHNALLILMKLMSLEVATEFRTSNGRIDLFIKTDKYLYIIELKLDKSAREALNQINEKNYALPFAADGRKVIKIGINFSTKTRTISEWEMEQ